MCGTYLECLPPKECVGNQSDTFHPLFKGQESQEDQESGHIMEHRSSRVFSYLDSHLLETSRTSCSQLCESTSPKKGLETSGISAKDSKKV